MLRLLLGGVILLPYALLAVVFAQTLTTPAGARGVTVLLLVATVAIAGVPAFLQGTRALEELDGVLGLLRAPEGARRAPQPTLAELDRLVADARDRPGGAPRGRRTARAAAGPGVP